MRDLNRVVGLLARRNDTFCCVPADWRRLLEWAERLLTRYKRTRENKVSKMRVEGEVRTPGERLVTAVDEKSSFTFFLFMDAEQGKRVQIVY